MTTSIAQVIDELAEDFALLDEWEDRYRHLIDLGRKLPEWPEADRRAEELVAGCQSRVWLRASRRDDRLHFQAVSDGAIVQGLLALILSVYQDRSPAEILSQAPDFLARLGLAEHLSPSRRNGTQAVIGRIRALAAAAS